MRWELIYNKPKENGKQIERLEIPWNSASKHRNKSEMLKYDEWKKKRRIKRPSMLVQSRRSIIQIVELDPSNEKESRENSVKNERVKPRTLKGGKQRRKTKLILKNLPFCSLRLHLKINGEKFLINYNSRLLIRLLVLRVDFINMIHFKTKNPKWLEMSFTPFVDKDH